MQTKLPDLSTVGHFDSRPLAADENFLLHLAPVSLGVFFFGGFHANSHDNVQAHRALFKTSFLYRHFLEPGGLKVVIDQNSLVLAGMTSSSAVSLMGYLLGIQIMGPNIKITDETTQALDRGGALRSGERSADGELRARLQLILATDSRLGSEDIKIIVCAGEVKIRGKVSSAANKQWAESLLCGVAPQAKLSISLGAGKCNGGVLLRPLPSIDADSLQALALTRLKLLATLGPLDVRVHCQRQVLSLSGRVRSDAERRLAESVVRHTYGLRDFKGSLSVK